MVIVLAVGGSLLGYAAFTGQFPSVYFGPGSQQPVVLALISYTISNDQNQQNPTVASIWLRNLGGSTASISKVTIQDAAGNSNPVYAFYPNQAIGSRGATTKVVVDTLSSGFYFSHGNAYAFTITSNPSFTISFHVSY